MECDLILVDWNWVIILVNWLVYQRLWFWNVFSIHLPTYYRKTGTGPVSGKIESLGVTLAEIQDDIIDEATDPESDSVAQAPQKSHHMKSQPIGKLYIEQTRMYNYGWPSNSLTIFFFIH